jgi:hypothetical protein
VIHTPDLREVKTIEKGYARFEQTGRGLVEELHEARRAFKSAGVLNAGVVLSRFDRSTLL